MNVSRKITKLLFWGVFTLFSLIILASCNGGKYEIIKGEIESTDHSIDGSYAKFSGYYYKEVELRNRNMVNINFHAYTQRGSLILELVDTDGNIIYKTKSDDISNRKIFITYSGKYKFEVIGKNHKGSFDLGWRIG